MVNGKPTLTFGDGQLPSPSRVQKAGGRSASRGAQAANTPGSFASYLPTAENAAGQNSPSAQARAAANQGDAGRKSGLFSSLNAKVPSLPAQDARPAENTGSMPRPLPDAGSSRVLSTAVRKQAQPLGAQSFSAAREDAQRRAEAMPGMARRIPAASRERISGRPITGRNDIGMEDTRKSGLSPLGRGRLAGSRGSAGTDAPAGRAAPGSINYSLNSPAFTTGYSGGMDLSSARTTATLAKVLENGDRPIRTLNSLTSGTAFGNAAAFPGMGDAARAGLRTAGERQRGAAAPLESPLFSGESTKSLVKTFRQLGGGNGEQPIGALAAKFESGAEGISAIGYDRHGGTSYGKYQISSRAGTMKNFITYLEDKAPDLARRLASSGPANTGGRRGAMPDEWKKIAEEQPDRFEDLQGDFIRSSHFEPAMQAIEESTGVAFNNMPPALQEVLFSTAVQHGPSGAARIVSKAVNEVGAGKLRTPGGAPESFKRAGRALIKEIYSLRAGQFMSSTSHVQSSVRNRLSREMQEALNMLA